MFHKKESSSKGFTIIEVLIVLAIAGLIMLIVFLAVPALQRNQRNTSRNNDAGNAASILQESISNNNGKPVTGAVTGTISSTSVLATIPAVLQNANYGVMDFMDYGMVLPGVANTVANIPDAHSLELRNNLKCNNSGATPYIPVAAAPPIALTIGNAATNIVTATGASARNFVVIYAVEGVGANVTLRCLES